MTASSPLRLQALNHISRSCFDVEATASWYQRVLGFVRIHRPSFDCEGVWLFSFEVGIGVHLIKRSSPAPACDGSREIDPKQDHLSFQAESLSAVKDKLNTMDVSFVVESVEEGGVEVTQVFFLDPEGNMIEVCDCDCLPVRPIEGDLPAFSAAIFRRDDVHKELVRQKSRKLEQVAAVLQRADSPTSPLPAEYPGEYAAPAHMQPEHWRVAKEAAEVAQQRRPQEAQ